MDNAEVLWLDDDSPEKVNAAGGLKVITAQSCAEADELLKSGKVKPRWVVVDLIVPQGNWGQPAHRLPGLNFIKHLRQLYGGEFGIVAYSIVMPPELAEKALVAGAEKAFAKPAMPWSEILEDFRKQL